MSPDRRLGLLLFLAAVLASLAVSVFVCGAPRPPGQFLKYLDAAAKPTLALDRRLDYSPLYLTVVRTLGGAAGSPQDRGRRVIRFQCGLLALACGAATLFLYWTWGARSAVIGLLLAVTYRPFIVYAAVVEPESVVVSLLAATILCGAALRKRIFPELFGILGSLGVGLCALLRPTFVPLIPCWALWVFATGPAGRRTRKAFSALGISLLLVLPVVLENVRKSGTPIFMDPGPAFYEGNGPLATGLTAVEPELVVKLEALQPPGNADYLHVAFRRIASAALGRPVTGGESNTFWMRLAVESIRSSPGTALARDLRKLAFTTSPYEAHDLIIAEDLDRRLRGRLPWGFSAILVGLPLLFFLGREDWEALAPPAAVGLLVIAVQVVFYASARQRLPLALFGILAVAAGAGRLLARRAARARAALGFLFGGIALLVGLGWLAAPFQWDLETGLLTFFGPAAAPQRPILSDLLEARALRPEAREAAILVENGRELYLHGRFAESVQRMEPVVSGTVSASRTSRKDAAFWSSRACLALGDRERAKESARQAVAAAPSDLRSQALWEVLNGRQTDLAEAVVWRPRGIDSISARVALGRELSFSGRRDVAVRLASTVVPQFPEIAGKPWP